MKHFNLQDWFGSIDIYLFDQLLKERISPPMKILDAGCGSGRNLNYFFKTGFDVCGVDQSPEAIAQSDRWRRNLHPISLLIIFASSLSRLFRLRIPILMW